MAGPCPPLQACEHVPSQGGRDSAEDLERDDGEMMLNCLDHIHPQRGDPFLALVTDLKAEAVVQMARTETKYQYK